MFSCPQSLRTRAQPPVSFYIGYTHMWTRVLLWKTGQWASDGPFSVKLNHLNFSFILFFIFLRQTLAKFPRLTSDLRVFQPLPQVERQRCATPAQLCFHHRASRITIIRYTPKGRHLTCSYFKLITGMSIHS